MTTSLRLKTALLAAASLTAATAATAYAADRAPMEPVAIEHAIAAVDHGEADKAAPASAVKGWTLAAGAAAALAAIARLVGFRRIAAAAKAAGPAARRAASAAVTASGEAVKAVGRAVASPVRFILLMAGLGVFALTGLGLYDIEWAGGLIAGVVIAATFFLGARKLRKTLVPSRIRASR
jgi:hypothetical protein